MLAWAEVSSESPRTLWRLEQSSFINERADILTATKIQLLKVLKLKVLQKQLKKKKSWPQKGTCPWKSRWQGSSQHMHQVLLLFKSILYISHMNASSHAVQDFFVWNRNLLNLILFCKERYAHTANLLNTN